MNTWDEAKRRRNLNERGIDFTDLEGFFDGDLLTLEDTREAYGEVRYQSIGVFNGVALVRSVDATRRARRHSSSHLRQKGRQT